MNSPTPLQLKIPRGWFAAGQPIEKALHLLSDGAFKLFVYLCLQARRDTGTLETSQNRLANNLHKSRRSVGSYLQQLQQAGVCRFHMTQNPHAQGVIEITEDYWPYQRSPRELTPEDESSYVAEVKKQFLARACVNSPFSVADERLARQWFEQGIPLERIEQTLLLGCVRKYVAWRNGQNRSPIASLRYFESTLEEVSAQKVGQPYWDYMRSRLERLERLWLESQHPQPSTLENPANRQPPVSGVQEDPPSPSQIPPTTANRSLERGS
jgi:hypothetical protein